MSEKNATNKNSAYHAYLILGLKAEKEHVRDIKSSRAARGIPVFQGGTVLDNSGKKQSSLDYCKSNNSTGKTVHNSVRFPLGQQSGPYKYYHKKTEGRKSGVRN